MNCLRLVLAALAGVFAAASSALAAPLEAFGQLPQIQTIRISGDGTMLAMLTTEGDQQKIVVRRVDSADGARLINGGDHRIVGLNWYDNERLLIATPVQVRLAGHLFDVSDEVRLYSWRSLRRTMRRTSRRLAFPAVFP